MTKLVQAPVPSFPGYVVLEKIGSGAFGAVYRARDEQLGRHVALKVLLPGGAMDARARQRFLEEARALASVRHPNVLVIHSVLEANGRIGLVMELIEGQSFGELLQEAGSFSASEAARVGAELCRALAAVHAAGLVHRDVKLSNILRERGGRIVLTDFGLGVFITRKLDSETRGLVAGSPLFMAPEQARGEDVDARTDLYALGVVLYHLTTNKYPVYSDRLPLLLDQIQAGALVSLRDARPDLPEAFTHIVMKALSLRPEARFQSAGDMEIALLSCLGAASTVGETTAALPIPQGRNRWRGLELILRLGRRELRVAIGFSLLLLVSGGLFLHWHQSPSSIDDIAMAPPKVPAGAPDVTLAVDAADYAGAVARLKEASAAQERIAALEASETEHAAVSKALAAELEKVEAAVGGLDFDKAISIATAIPQPKSPVLAWKRTLAIEEGKLLQEAWNAVRDGVAKKSAANESLDLAFGPPSPAPPVPARLKGVNGGTISYQAANGGKVESRDISGLSTKCLRELAAAGAGSAPDALPPRVLEGLGLLVLDRQGPARGSEILADARLGETKIESYKVRLEEEKESFLGRVARVAQARAAKVKGKVAEAKALTADLTAWIVSCQPLPGYDRVKDTLAKAFLAARSESLRVGVPQSLISGKVQSYEPDGGIEILYDFNSEPEIKDFRSMKNGSLIELSEGRAKLRGEFRIGKGEMFRKRLSLLAEVPTDGYSPQSPNINFALWTTEADKLSPKIPKIPKNDAEAIPQPEEEPVAPAGLPQDYFVFGVGYRVHVYSVRHRAFECLSLRETNTPIQMPAYALIGGRRGQRVHEMGEEDCVWAMSAAGKVKGAQTVKIVMKPGELPVWIVNSRPMAIKDGKGTDLLRRAEPYTGSVTVFTNGEVIDLDSLFIEAELNPAWVEAQLAGIAEKELKKIEPNYPFAIANPNPEDEWNELLEGAGPKGKAAKKAKATGAKANAPPAENGG